MAVSFSNNFPLFPSIYIPLGSICLALGIFIYLKNKFSLLNRLYFFFCFGIFVWMIPVSLVNLNIFDYQINLLLAKIIFTSVVFLPTLALHFAIVYLDENVEKTVSRDLRIAYCFTFIFLFLLWSTNQFIVGLNHYPWGLYPKGGPIHVLHSIFVIATAIYMVHLLWHGMNLIKVKHGKTKKYHETKYVFIAFLFITMACTDFLQSWGVDFFPFGYFFVSVFFASTAYAIFRHELLGISVVIKKSLIYSILISLIASLYFTAVYIIGKFIGNLAKAQSAPVILIILAIITLLFKPLEQKIQSGVEKLFHKKPREVIEKENFLLREQVEQQDRMKAVAILAAGMAHEIKNPLTSIKTFAEYLPERYEDPDFRDKFKRIVVDEVARINNIVGQLLEFSKPQEPELKSASINGILNETIELLNNNLLDHRIQVVKNYGPERHLDADKAQLKQVFLNLFLNSIHAMPVGGTLSISTEPNNNSYKITITDTGYGIAEEDLKHVFEPFFTTRGDGTGLGLSIVHGIITKHGGKLEIKSRPGAGTTVSVILKSRS